MLPLLLHDSPVILGELAVTSAEKFQFHGSGPPSFLSNGRKLEGAHGTVTSGRRLILRVDVKPRSAVTAQCEPASCLV